MYGLISEKKEKKAWKQTDKAKQRKEQRDSRPVGLSAKVIQQIDPSLLAANSPGVTTKQSNDIQRDLYTLMNRPWMEWFPKVCVSYATGTRVGTDARTGCWAGHASGSGHHARAV